MPKKQKIVVFQQNNRGESKVAGIAKYGMDRFSINIISIDAPLPPVIDDARSYFPGKIEAGLVLDFLIHPDLSHDLAIICAEQKIPIVASGKKIDVSGVITPHT